MSDDDLTAYRFAEIKEDTVAILAQMKIINGRVATTEQVVSDLRRETEKDIARLQVAYGVGCALGVAGFYWLLGNMR